MLEKLYTKQYIQTPSMVVKREVYETIGCFDRRLNCMEDWEMWIRIANNYQIAISNKVLSAYRSHKSNTTHKALRDDTSLEEHQLICDLVDGYVQLKIKKNFSINRNKAQAAYWLISYQNTKNELSLKEKWSFIIKILKLDFNLKYIYRIFR